MRNIGNLSRNDLSKKHLADLQLRHNELLKENNDLQNKYKTLVRFTINAAFNDWNTNVEDLFRILRRQGQIELDEETQRYINPLYQSDKEYCEANNISNKKDKMFEIDDDNISDYTKQLETKLNRIKNIFKEELEIEKTKEFLNKEEENK